MWRDALVVFGRRAALLLLIAIAGYAVPAFLLQVVDAPPIETYLRNQSTFCAFRNPLGSVTLFLAGAGLLAQIVTQGLITTLALGERRLSLRSACRITLATLPMLLFVCFLYGVFLSIVSAGLSQLPLTLHLDPMQLRTDIPFDRPFELVQRELLSQAVNAALPDPGTLFCDVAQAIRMGGTGRVANAAAMSWYPAMIYAPPAASTGVASSWPSLPGSAVLWVVLGVLLRFRVAAVLAEGATPRHGFLQGIGVAWRSFGTVTLHAALLHVSVACAQVIFVLAPVELAELIVIPRLGLLLNEGWVCPATLLLVAASAAIINAIGMAFGVVYDTRLYLLCSQAGGHADGITPKTINSSAIFPDVKAFSRFRG